MRDAYMAAGRVSIVAKSAAARNAATSRTRAVTADLVLPKLNEDFTRK
jgi:hypothetical protein